MENVNIRVASPDDAEKLLEIYAPYVEKTAITFEYDVPTVHEFKKRIENTLERYPYLVAEVVQLLIIRQKRQFILTKAAAIKESAKGSMLRLKKYLWLRML